MNRQARLRSEYAFVYPSVKPGVWEPAVTLADRLLADSLLHGRGAAFSGRTLPEVHFEFRGGSSRGGERLGVRSTAPLLADLSTPMTSCFDDRHSTPGDRRNAAGGSG